MIDGELVKVGGNPEDPNNGKSLCAKGQSGPEITPYADRLLYPLERVGPGGSGQWRRIAWDEALDRVATRIRKTIDDGHPEETALHIGRSRIGEEMTRFLNAIGSPSLFNHRALCSSNKRAANYVSLGDTDWETPDAEHTKYILNFGAKLVTLDVRLSNTAGRSDEWWAPNPGSEGAIALAMGHTIMEAGLADRAFLDDWCNVGTAELPACVAFTNRGSSAHYNGFNNDRAVILLNAIVGSIGQPGGYCYGEEPTRVPPRVFPQPSPQPPAPTAKSAIEIPPDWPPANKWQRMKVGQIVYDYLKQGCGKLQVYISYILAAPQTWPEGRSLAVDVLKDEKLIPFHVCSDLVYSETSHYADLILPEAAYLERWGFDTRNNMELRDCVAMRQPLTAPPGECRSFVDVMIALGQRISPETAQYFNFKDREDRMRQRCTGLTARVGEDGFGYRKKARRLAGFDQAQVLRAVRLSADARAVEGHPRRRGQQAGLAQGRRWPGDRCGPGARRPGAARFCHAVAPLPGLQPGRGRRRPSAGFSRALWRGHAGPVCGALAPSHGPRSSAPGHLQVERAHPGPHRLAEVPERDRAPQPAVDASAGRRSARPEDR